MVLSWKANLPEELQVKIDKVDLHAWPKLMNKFFTTNKEY